MKDLKTYLECGEAGYSTPANTMGMGNPGEIAPGTLTEPVGGIEKTAKTLKQDERKKKKKKIKSLSESIFDDDLVTRDISKFGSMFKLDSVEIRDKVLKPKPDHGTVVMIDTNLKLGDLYKTTLLAKDTGIRVTKDPNTIAAALDKIICDTKITPEFFKMSLYDFGRMLDRENRRYYSSALLHDTYLNMSADVYVFDEKANYDDLVLDTDVIPIEFFHIILIYKKK